MNERKLSRGEFLTVVGCEKGISTPGYGGNERIYTERQVFRLMNKHLKDSIRPRGFFHKGWGSNREVEVQWLWTEALGYFAPEISFRPSKASTLTAKNVAEAIQEIDRTEQDSPEGLIEKLGATIVEYINDDKGGGYDDYRPLRVPGEPAMVTIARYAQEA